jgi:hypothetical protein
MGTQSHGASNEVSRVAERSAVAAVSEETALNAGARPDGRTSLWLRSRTAGLRDQRGSMIALLALTFTIVMGTAAITVDLGRAWVQDVRLQAAADAAALAGVRELPGGTAQALDAAQAILTTNGVDPAIATITIDTTLVPGDTVRVELNDTLPLLFAPTIGFGPTQAIGVDAAAVAGSLGASSGVMPWGLPMPPGGFEFATSYDIKVGAGGGEDGNYYPIRVDGSGASTYRDAIIDGSDATVSIGDVIQTEPGNMVGPTRAALDERIGDDPNTEWTDLVDSVTGELLLETDPNNPRILLVPVTTDPGGGASDVTVLAFAMFVIEGDGDDWDDGELEGVFVREVTEGEFGPLNGNPLTPTVLKLWS